MKVLGVDPGVLGGIAYVIDGELMLGFATPHTEEGFPDADSIKALFRDHKVEPDLVVIERVHAIFGCGAKSTFNFGRGYGFHIGLFSGLGYRVGLAAPKEWQAYAHQGITGIKNPKERSLIAAKKIFPHDTFIMTKRSRKPHDGVVDAALIASYGQFLLRDHEAMVKGSH